MATRQFRRGGFRTSRRHQFEWWRAEFDETVIAAASTKALVVGIAAVTGLDVTIERQYLSVLMTSASTADTNGFLALGSVIVSSDAFAAGAASVPGPVTDKDSPWVLHQNVITQNEFSSGVGFEKTAMSMFESKARRRMTNNELLALVLETDALSDAVTVRTGWSGLVRVQGT